MAVIEMQKEPRSIKSMLFIAALIVGFLALGAVIFWLVKPAAPRQVKLSGEQAKEQTESFVAPAPVLPAQPPLPQAQDPGPTMVNLDLKQVTARQAMAELAKQAKVDLKDDQRQQQQGFLAALLSERSDVSYKNEPFWTAMLDLCRKGNLTPYADWQQPNRITFMQGSATMGPKVTVGSCLVVLESVTSRFDANLTGPRPASRDLTVGLKLFVEPKLSPYRISTIATLETAVDENGTNLVRPRGQYDDRSGGGPQSNWMRDVTCNLVFPDNAGEHIAKLKGYASVAVAGPEKTEKIADPLTKKGIDTKIDGVLVRLVEVRKQGTDGYIVRMAGDANSPIFKDYDRFSKVVKLIDTNGKPFQTNGGSWGGVRAGTFEFSVNFTGPGLSEPKEMQITLPTANKEIRVPFEFKDLPLPH
ncbi:MAG: hypothetical protein QOE14_310 [Humisphaera sp.]|nr:hypothetical protein [Humisphaera sp.]